VAKDIIRCFSQKQFLLTISKQPINFSELKGDFYAKPTKSISFSVPSSLSSIAEAPPPKFMSKQLPNAYVAYAEERTLLSPEEINDLLEQGIQLEAQTTLTQTLSEKGSAFFPHTHIRSCGDQVAAVAHACLAALQKTGKNQILVIGVLHSITDTLRKALYRDLNNEDLSNEPCRGIFGPGLPNEEIFREEFSLDNFVFLLDHAVKKARH
jgi:hypothetical protein